MRERTPTLASGLSDKSRALMLELECALRACRELEATLNGLAESTTLLGKEKEGDSSVIESTRAEIEPALARLRLKEAELREDLTRAAGGAVLSRGEARILFAILGAALREGASVKRSARAGFLRVGIEGPERDPLGVSVCDSAIEGLLCVLSG